MISKAIYSGNLGFMEMVRFVERASKEEVEKMYGLLKEGKEAEALRLIEAWQGKKFHPSIYGPKQLLPSRKDPRKRRWMYVVKE